MMLGDSYWMEARWGGRIDHPPALAARFLRTVDAVGLLHPLLENWTWGNSPEIWETEGRGGTYPLAEARKDMARAVETNMGCGGDDEPDPFYGYLMIVMSELTPPGSRAKLAVSAGKGIRRGPSVSPFTNNASFSIAEKPDPSLITYDLWRAAFLLLAETWEATWAEASPDDIKTEWSGYPVRCAWMSYVSPRFAPLIAPPASAIVEHRANGGLFLAATDEVFRTANPEHLAASRRIEAALQPLNRLPFPIDDPYR